MGFVSFYEDENCTNPIGWDTVTDKLTVYAKFNEDPDENGMNTIHVQSAETPWSSYKEARCYLRKKTKATVTTVPTAKNLNYTGSAQELVTAGTAEGGTIQYAIGENATTAPTTDKFATSIPAATDVGT